MKTNYLLPNKFKKIGWILFIPGFILGILFLILQEEPKFLDIQFPALVDSPFMNPTSFFTMAHTNAIDEIICLLLIIGSIFIALSKEKHEDEFISNIRLESLVWATYINYAILILAIIFVFEGGFFWVIAVNMFTILIFFVIRFNWAMYKSKKMIRDEE